MMAIDGTWRRPCTMLDASDTGARLSIDGSVEGLAMKEIFLVLSTVGSISAVRTRLGQWRSGWRPFHQARREEEKLLKGASGNRGSTDGHLARVAGVASPCQPPDAAPFFTT